jgi:Uma2 family endonuclease
MDSAMTVARPHRFTVAEYHRMAEAGILGEDSRVELIRGQIVDMAPIGAPHLGMVNRLTRLLPSVLSGRGLLSVQNPVRLNDGSEPEPDVVVLRPRTDDYETATPCPSDVLLLIEVADSNLDDDRGIKAPLYAEDGVAECWIVNFRGSLPSAPERPLCGRPSPGSGRSPGHSAAARRGVACR